MGGAYQIYVVRTLVLKLQKYLGKAAYRYFFAEIFGGYPVILAEAAFKAAARKEHRARTSCARNARLLPHMQIRFCKPRESSAAAESHSFCPVGSAAAGAKLAAF